MRFSYRFQLMLHWMLNRASPGPCALQHKVPVSVWEQWSAPRQLLWSSMRHCPQTWGTSARGTGETNAAHLRWSLTSSKAPKNWVEATKSLQMCSVINPNISPETCWQISIFSTEQQVGFTAHISTTSPSKNCLTCFTELLYIQFSYPGSFCSAVWELGNVH